MTQSNFDAQFTLSREHYLANLDMVTWIRHYHVLRDVLSGGEGDVLEIGTGDGVVKRCTEPFVRSYKVLDINPNLDPDFLADIRRPTVELNGRFDTIVITEVMEHMPFEDMQAVLRNLHDWLRPGGRVLVSLPHRKSSIAIIPPSQRLRTVRFPNGTISVSEFYNRFIRRKIWIDPNHVWEIGAGKVGRDDVERRFVEGGFTLRKRRELPYSDYWVLDRVRSTAV